MNILVTGANGFVGASLIPRLVEGGHHVTALVRDKKKNKRKGDGIKWLEGDLLRPEDLPELEGIDRAYYLIHGLKGESQVFEHQEAMQAVNFINWIRPSNSGIIYLGGLGPENVALSPHLRSRFLTGAILRCSGLPTIEFRASIVLGEDSLSFEMIKALTERLPVRPELKILNQPCQPISLSDLLKYLVNALDVIEGAQGIVEIGGPEVKTYGELLDLYAELSGLKRKKIKLPEVEAKVLMKVIDYALPEHAQVGKKLIESLEFPTVITNDSAKRIFPEIHPMELRVAMDMARASSKTHYAPLWEKDFLRILLSDKILTQSGLLSPELLKNLEKVGKIKDILSRK